jgi:histone H3/H4
MQIFISIQTKGIHTFNLHLEKKAVKLFTHAAEAAHEKRQTTTNGIESIGWIDLI